MLPKKSQPTREQIRQWLNYATRKVVAQRFAMRAIVYSDNQIKKPVGFSLSNYEVMLYPVLHTAQHVFGSCTERFMPGFTCELVSKVAAGPGQMGSLFDLHKALDCIMPLLGFDYSLSMDFEMWQEYDGTWLPVQAFSGAVKFLHSHADLPNPNIHAVVAAYETLSRRMDKRSKKFAKLRERLKDGASLANVSQKYGFLAYYGVIETIADDLLGPTPEGKPHPQKMKLEKLLNLFPHMFNVEDCIKLATIRNTLAHSDATNFQVEADLCKRLALWASECVALQLVGETEREAEEAEAQSGLITSR